MDRILSGGDAGLVTPAHMGNLGSGLMRYGSLEGFRANTPLPEDAQKLFDTTVVEVGLDRLVIVRRMLELGLTFSVPNWLSVLQVTWDKVSKSGTARRSMNPSAQGENQLADRTQIVYPVYCTTDNFNLDIRLLLASQRAGAPLDVSQLGQSTRRVNEAIEDAAWNGSGMNVSGNSAPGFLGAPDVGTFAYVDGESWAVAGHSGEDILADVLGMIDVAQAAKKYGPYDLCVPTNYGNKLNADFKSNGDKTIRQRLEEIVAGGRKLHIEIADQLPTNRTVLWQTTSDVADVIVGQEPAPVSWSTPSGWEFTTVVLACMIPRVKSDADGNSGIVTGNLT